jgi:uncharacterized membrane protein
MYRSPRLFGHPIHPALVHLPIGLLVMSFIWDIVTWAGGSPFWYRLSFWTMGAALLWILPTAVTGLLEFFTIPRRHPAFLVATAHMILNVLAAGAFATSWLLRRGDPAGGRLLLAYATSIGGLAILCVAGVLGGRLVFRYGVGREVVPVAPPQAPEELRPAA